MQQVGTLESLSDLVKLLLEPAFGVVSNARGRKGFLILREVVAVGALLSLLFARSWEYLFLTMMRARHGRMLYGWCISGQISCGLRS